MGKKKITEHPSLTDTIAFELTVPQDDLYCVEQVIILHLNSQSKEAVPVVVLGDEDDPAWTAEKGMIDLKKTGPGEYEWNWQPSGRREGSYFITWNYKLAKDGLVKTHTSQFYVTAAPPANAPRQWTDPNKYTTLLDRYLPSVYKTQIMEDDITPQVIQKLHNAVARGFTDLENLANQLADTTDANYTSEALMPILANFFDIKLRGGDPTRWRRQIKQTPLLYKAKGTQGALKEALDQAGIKLNKVTKLWQVVSPWHWIDSLKVKDDNHTFDLTKQPLKVLRVALRVIGESQYVELPSDYVVILSPKKPGEKFKAVWAGAAKEEPIQLFPGDILRVEYNHRNMTPEQEELNNYILSLPLADRRDESEQEFPLKNWNVRVMEEDDPLFSRVIADRHPFHEPLVFGKVRTTFMYSEKVYNMDTYDGSLRDSTVPCDIDRDFLDSCANCQGSKFSVDLEITNLSNDKIQEATEIIEEFAPFHAVLHSMNIRGKLQDFVLPPVDRVESKVKHRWRKTKEQKEVASTPGFVDEIGLKDRISFTITYKDGTKEEGEL